MQDGFITADEMLDYLKAPTPTLSMKARQGPPSVEGAVSTLRARREAALSRHPAATLEVTGELEQRSIYRRKNQRRSDLDAVADSLRGQP